MTVNLLREQDQDYIGNGCEIRTARNCRGPKAVSFDQGGSNELHRRFHTQAEFRIALSLDNKQLRSEESRASSRFDPI